MEPSRGRIPPPGSAGFQAAVSVRISTTGAYSARDLGVTAGPDDRDRRSLPAPTVRYEDAIETLDVGALRARGSLDLGFGEDVDPEVAEIARVAAEKLVARSEEHTSELQSLMRISYAVFCLKKKKTKQI